MRVARPRGSPAAARGRRHRSRTTGATAAPRRCCEPVRCPTRPGPAWWGWPTPDRAEVVDVSSSIAARLACARFVRGAADDDVGSDDLPCVVHRQVVLAQVQDVGSGGERDVGAVVDGEQRAVAAGRGPDHRERGELLLDLIGPNSRSPAEPLSRSWTMSTPPASAASTNWARSPLSRRASVHRYSPRSARRSRGVRCLTDWEACTPGTVVCYRGRINTGVPTDTGLRGGLPAPTVIPDPDHAGAGVRWREVTRSVSVVGGGVIGLSIAWRAAQSGWAGDVVRPGAGERCVVGGRRDAGAAVGGLAR